ncbi:MAG: flagellar filament capping protein FliD [Thermaerobacter sp.]|nr:flagellar filament capping protein FliD [Thermaerobacter sp.]
MNNIRTGMRFGGLATGLDTQTMVRDLVRAESMRVNRLTQNRTQLEWRREDMRTLNTQLTTLRNRAFDMTLQGSYRRFTAATTNDRAVTAVPTGAASDMGFEFSAISRLASSATATSAGSIVVTPHTRIDPTVPLGQLISAGQIDGAPLAGATDLSVTLFNHNQAGTRVSETITINTATDSLNTVLNRINSSATLGLQAFYDEFSGRVSLTSRFTGNNNAAGADIGFEGTHASFFTQTLRLSPVQDGQNAQFTLNGLATERPSNTFTLNGVAFTLRNTLPAGERATVTVATDRQSVVKSISDFVTLYNETLNRFNTQLTAPRHREFLPLTDEQKNEMSDDEVTRWQERARSGLLRGDDLLERVVGRMRRDFTDPMPDPDATLTLRQMTAIGITTRHHTERGRLHLDENVLQRELEKDAGAVEALFRGVATRLRTALDSGVREINLQAGGTSGFNLADNSVIGQQMRRLDERIGRENDRIARVEERHWRQFTALERAMDRMNSQSAWLSQQFAAPSQ